MFNSLTLKQQLSVIRKYPHVLSHICGKDRALPLHTSWIKHIWDTEEFTSLMAHRGSFKTTNIIIIGTIWWMLFHPNDRIGLVRKSHTLACEVLSAVRKLMMKPEVQVLFNYANGFPTKFRIKKGDKLEFNFKTTVTPEGNIDAYGLGTGIVGKHYDKIICDDFITIEDRLSKAEREKTKEIVRELKTNIIDPGKQISFIGTKWHKDDAWNICPEPLIFDCYSTGLLSEAEIQDKRKNTTAMLFSANYELKIVADENAEYKDPQFGIWHEGMHNVVAHVDAGFQGDCTTALTIMSNRKDSRLQAYGKVYESNINVHFDDITKLCKDFGVKCMYMESNADKGFSAEEFRKRGLQVSEYHEKENKHIKISNYLKKHWYNLLWNNKADPQYMIQVTDYLEGSIPCDAPDSVASLLREAFDNNGAGFLEAITA